MAAEALLGPFVGPVVGTAAQGYQRPAVTDARSAYEHVLTGLKLQATRLVEQLEALPADQRKTRADTVEGVLLASQDWADANPYDSAHVGGALAIRLYGGWDSRRSLFSRVAAARGSITARGFAGGWNSAAPERAPTITERAQGAVIEFARSDAGAATRELGDAIGQATGDAAEAVRGAGRAAADAADYLPLVLGALALAVVLGLFLRVRG